ncbi:dnaJ homolog subfamily C member 8-like [Oscarella lobularis]|uniref:dnaJ homolog subfamily C member 8-like n=1 Tax=Oscarella lobularis TaxID=121494 RepID=UPI00331395CB
MGEEGGEEKLTDFLLELKEIEKRDSVLTSAQQIDRLLRPGATYFNMNPYDVLQIPFGASKKEVDKQFRKLSFLVHPDKNADDCDRAQKAFDALNTAHLVFDDEEELERVEKIVKAGQELVERNLKEKRKQAKKQGLDRIDEDDPDRFAHFSRCTIAKLFADLDKKKKHLAQREQEEKKRQQQLEEVEQNKKKKEKQFEENWDATRGHRVTNWRTFQSGGKKKKNMYALKRAPYQPEKRKK